MSQSLSQRARLDRAVCCALARGFASGELEPVSRFQKDTECYLIASAIQNQAHLRGFYSETIADKTEPGWVYVKVSKDRRPGFEDVVA